MILFLILSRPTQNFLKSCLSLFTTEVHNIAQNENCQYGPNISPCEGRKQAHI